MELSKEQNKIAKKEVTPCQIDILYTLLTDLKDDPNHTTYSFTKNRIEQLTGRVWTWSELQEGTSHIGSRTIIIETDEFYQQLWLFSRVRFENDGSKFTIFLNKDGCSHLIELKKRIHTLDELKNAIAPLKIESKKSKN